MLDMNNNPINNISVLMCTYNPEEEINEQIRSIYNSGNNELKITLSIFDDSNSNKNAHTSINNIQDFDVEIFQGCQQGSACSNFIYAINQIDADWLFLSDQDDIWEKCKIEEYLKIARDIDNSIPQIIFSDASLINSKGELIASSFYQYQGLSLKVMESDDILFQNCVQGATLLLNKKMINLIKESLNGEDSNGIAMHDWWIAILARYYGNWTYIDKPLIQYRQHERNVVGAKKKSNLFIKLIRNPLVYYSRLKSLKKQYQLWLKVSQKMTSPSDFTPNHMKISLLSRCKLISFSFIF